ncbi:hypothetical protein M885DRAFT_623063 [Pelagophyceae sp. CCMP2097]|nr:hypothetical protein M885DRAFT_623063 [Pelagophyceae sp. CCMP2097]
MRRLTLLTLKMLCLTTVFKPLVESLVNEHFESMRSRRKRRSTRNPDYPSATYRVADLFENGHGDQRPANHQINVSSAAISAVDDRINTYYGAAQNVEPASAWETDPLATPRMRRKRARRMRGLAPFERLEDEYIAMRRITRKLRPPCDSDS